MVPPLVTVANKSSFLEGRRYMMGVNRGAGLFGHALSLPKEPIELPLSGLQQELDIVTRNTVTVHMRSHFKLVANTPSPNLTQNVTIKDDLVYLLPPTEEPQLSI